MVGGAVRGGAEGAAGGCAGADAAGRGGGRGPPAALGHDLLRRGGARDADHPRGVPHPQRGRRAALARDHKRKEAVAWSQAQIAARPKSAWPHIRYAYTLLRANAGMLARAEAPRAVELEPQNAHAWTTLGWMRSHDALGRRHRAGMDAAGAIAAYQRALELDPSLSQPLVLLGELYEFGEGTRKYAAGAQLDKAFDAFHRARVDFDNHAGDEQELIDALRLGKAKEALALLESQSASAVTTARRVLALTLQGGAAKARQQLLSEGMPPQEVEVALTNGLSAFLIFGRMDLATDVFKQLTPAVQDNRRFDAFKAAQTFDPDKLSVSDPAQFPLVLIRDLMRDTLNLELLDPIENKGEDDAASIHRASKDLRRLLPVEMAGAGGLAIRLSLAAVRTSVEGGPQTGFRVGVAALTSNRAPMYLNADGGKVHALCFSPCQPTLGRMALRMLAQGRLEAARQWLDWARDEAAQLRPSPTNAFVRLWPAARPEANEVKRAATALAALDGKSAEAQADLRKMWAAETDGELKQALGWSLLSSLARGKSSEEALTVITELQKQAPKDLVLLATRVLTLRHLGRDAESLAVAQKAVEDAPYELGPKNVLQEELELRGDFAGARKVLDAGVASCAESERSHWLNSRAWLAFVEDRVTPAALDDAQIAAQKAPKGSTAAANTLAVLQAAAGKTEDARETLAGYTDTMEVDAFGDADWLAVGLMYDRDGLRDAAAWAYARVKIPEGKLAIGSSPALVERERKRLEKR
ncbi:MAG: hypothetical protein JST92_13815 [Deltaproteobacteria bacterium]|nr:hypothetical protein [Deltaproteobacteria bacterium]